MQTVALDVVILIGSNSTQRVIAVWQLFAAVRNQLFDFTTDLSLTKAT